MNEERKRQSLVGKVISANMQSTVNVRVTREIPHPVYKKRVKKYKNYLVHVTKLKPSIGDIVKIVSIKPISKRKRWQISEVVREVANLSGK
tara:strand:+ start:1959 stop:2231 length:273 start_codon:yes stop_codon:yes gene_type:complete